jgi:hypothetical protein
MRPSAEASVATREWYERISVQPTVHGRLEELASALEDAYRDGFLAAVALLREDSIFNAARSKVMGLPDWTPQTGVTNVQVAGDIARTAIAAIGAKLEDKT